MKKKYDVIGFDVDNTFYKIDGKVQKTIWRYISQKSAEQINVNSDEFYHKFVKLYQEKKSASTALKELGISDGPNIVQEAMENANVAENLRKDHELINLMNFLKPHYKLFIITGGTKKATSDKLKALGLEQSIFDPIITTPEYNLKREDGGAFFYVSRYLSVDFKKILFVGDREKVDIIPANNLGIDTVIVNKPDNQESQATYILEKIYNLKDIAKKKYLE